MASHTLPATNATDAPGQICAHSGAPLIYYRGPSRIPIARLQVPSMAQQVAGCGVYFSVYQMLPLSCAYAYSSVIREIYSCCLLIVVRLPFQYFECCLEQSAQSRCCCFTRLSSRLPTPVLFSYSPPDSSLSRQTAQQHRDLALGSIRGQAKSNSAVDMIRSTQSMTDTMLPICCPYVAHIHKHVVTPFEALPPEGIAE